MYGTHPYTRWPTGKAPREPAIPFRVAATALGWAAYVWERSHQPPVRRRTVEAVTHVGIELHVNYVNGNHQAYAVDPGGGWRFDVTHRQLIIGGGVPRVCIPLDLVTSYEIVPTAGTATPAGDVPQNEGERRILAAARQPCGCTGGRGVPHPISEHWRPGTPFAAIVVMCSDGGHP